MSVDRKELINEVHDAALVTGGGVGISIASKKIANMPLSTPKSLKGAAKLALAVRLSTMAVKWAQGKKYLPDRW